MLNKQGPGKIDWCDFSWNPISGCLHGCDYCYLRRMQGRFGHDFMTPKFHSDRLFDLRRSRKLKPGDKIFVGSSGDMFGDFQEAEHICSVLNELAEYQHCIFQFLTKNPKRYAEFCFWNNCWLGVTIERESAETVNRYRNFIFGCGEKRNLKFISFEPLLGEGCEKFVLEAAFHPPVWIVIGGNSNPGALKPPDEWADKIIAEARTYNIPVWVKDNYKYRMRIKEFPSQKRCV